jgi:hypothetical protein
MASTGPRRDTQEGLAALDRCVVGKSRCLLPLRNPSALSAVESLAAGGVPRRPEARRVSRSLLRDISDTVRPRKGDFTPARREGDTADPS